MTEKLFADIEYNLKFIEEQIAKAAQSSGRLREDITFLAATKTVDAQRINFAISKGLRYIGENRVQELMAKYDEYDLKNAQLQFIGSLQTNKVRQIVGKVSLIQSVNSLKLAQEVSKQSQKSGVITDVLIEVNIGNEQSKSGIDKTGLEELLLQVNTLPALKVKGLMCIPPIYDDKTKIIKKFDEMKQLNLDICAKKIDNIDMNILSMGMSSDYYEAILSGANMVRIGSALFGPRLYA
ncbi:MAG: YggS family pyridoxal phosphate-dependent enzyme [Oscillospiraceae bacterium]|jgi:pyridoxal phosphate enzyme (YggS family)|nr:YggS family pyridoxal phosphate-dependent enzyme [Oscillospiraceae bacterium]